MDHEDGYWHCDQTNRTWLVLEKPFDSCKEHTATECLGRCAVHSLIDDTSFHLIHSEAFGICWGDIILVEQIETLAAESDEDRKMRLAAEAAAEEKRRLASKATEMERYARLKAQTNTQMVKTDRGKIAVIRKIQEPCKWLYLDEKAPKHEWRTTRTGKREPPYRLHLTGAECWAFEYHDPKTGKLQIKHTCDHLHPGEEGWCAEWKSDSRWRRTAAAPREFGCHSDSASTVSASSATSFQTRAEPPPKPSSATTHTKRAAVSGFSILALEDSDSE